MCVYQAVPTLGNVCEASWETMGSALIGLKYPFTLKEVPAQLLKAKGGPMYNLLHSSHAVLIVGLAVQIAGCNPCQHAILVCTKPAMHAPYGKLVDNHARCRPVYLEPKDLFSKPTASRVFQTLVGQNPAVFGRGFVVNICDAYELVCTAEVDTQTLNTPRLGERVCFACWQTLPPSDFSTAQRAKGPRGRCHGCVGVC